MIRKLTNLLLLPFYDPSSDKAPTWATNLHIMIENFTYLVSACRIPLILINYMKINILIIIMINSFIQEMNGYYFTTTHFMAHLHLFDNS